VTDQGASKLIRVQATSTPAVTNLYVVYDVPTQALSLEEQADY
jgi:hypothetical protein